LKILHIIDSGGLYGAEVMLLNLVAEQVKLGLEPVIASIGETGINEKPLEAEANRRNLAVRKFRMRPGPNLAGAIKVLNYARSGGFDLLHSHGYKGNILFGLTPRFFRKIPMVSTLHGYTNVGGFSRMRLYEWLDSLSLRFIDAVVLVNQAMRNHSRLKKLSGINFKVVNNGIPISSETPESPSPGLAIQPIDHLNKKIIDFCSNGFTIGSIGRLSAEKNYSGLIEAIHIVHRRGNRIKLLIIGEGPERIALEKQVAELGLEDHVMLPGYRKNARDYLSLFKVFVLSSLTEGLPITLLEAMSVGVPVVATRVGGIPEVLGYGRAGVLIPENSSEDIATAIISLFGNPEKRAELGRQGQSIVGDRYNSRRMAEQYLEIYKKLIHPSGN
jgi:glycosyltransferase involved in cell wall biosynthesis